MQNAKEAPTQARASTRVRVRELLQSSPGFRRLWLGNLISSSGDWIGWVAVSILAMQSQSSTLALAGVFVAHYLPSALLAPVGGYVADRWDRKKILVYVTLGQILVTALMAAAAIEHEVRIVQILLTLRSTATAFIAPAERGAIPRLVRKDQVLLANTLDSATWSTMFTLGTALGGLLAVLGPSTALCIDTATFCVAVWFYAKIPNIPTQGPRQPESAQDPPTPRLKPPSMGQVLGWLYRNPKVTLATFAKSPLSLASGAAWLGLNLRASDTGLSPSIALGIFYATRGVGTAIGPWIAEQATERGFRQGRVWMLMYMTGIAAMIGFWYAQSWAGWLGGAIVWGLSGGVNWVVSTAITQEDTPDLYRGRIGALDTLAWMASQCLGVSVCAWWVHRGQPLHETLLLSCALGVLGILLLQLNTLRRPEPR